MHDFDEKSGILIFSQISKNGLSCWNSAMPLTPTNNPLIIQNNATMTYPADLNVSRIQLHFAEH